MSELPTTNLPDYPPGDPGPIAALDAPDVPLFCSLCQRHLVPRRRHICYDERNGVEITELELVCPRVAHRLGWLIGLYHDVWSWHAIPAVLRERSVGGLAPRGGYRKYGFWSKADWR